MCQLWDKLQTNTPLSSVLSLGIYFARWLAEWLTDYKKSLNSRHSLTRLNQPFFLATFARYFDRECGVRAGRGPGRGQSNNFLWARERGERVMGEDSQLAENCIRLPSSPDPIRFQYYLFIFRNAVAPIPFVCSLDRFNQKRMLRMWGIPTFLSQQQPVASSFQ